MLVDGFERDMNEINVEDIQDFSVLKDASATAIYGSRGANGSSACAVDCTTRIFRCPCASRNTAGCRGVAKSYFVFHSFMPFSNIGSS